MASDEEMASSKLQEGPRKSSPVRMSGFMEALRKSQSKRTVPAQQTPASLSLLLKKLEGIETLLAQQGISLGENAFSNTAGGGTDGFALALPQDLQNAGQHAEDSPSRTQSKRRRSSLSQGVLQAAQTLQRKSKIMPSLRSEFTKRMTDQQTQDVPWYLIRQGSRVFNRWNAWIIVLVMIEMMHVPFTLSFNYQWSSWYHVAEYASDIMFIVDFGSQFFTTYFEGRREIVDVATIRKVGQPCT